MQTDCTKCNGTGKVIKYPCTTCNGVGTKPKNVVETVNIPKGVDTGQTIRVSGKGHASANDGPGGDLLITISVKPHPVFRRRKFDIYTDVEIPLFTAVLGGTVDIETLYGTVEMKIPPGTC